MSFNRQTAQRVYDTISKMDDDEAEVFGLILAHEMWSQDIQNNARSIHRAAMAYDDQVTEDVSKFLVDFLDEGGDPEEAVAIAAAVAVAKADDNDWWKFQARDSGGRFGRMTGAHYRAQKKKIKADDAAAMADLKAQRRGYYGSSGQHYNDVRAAGNGAVNGARRFEAGWNKQSDGESPTTQTFNRLQAGGQLVQQIGAQSGSGRIATAGAVANYAGQFGPEAEKVVGPSMRKAAYRYRGTERTPDKELSVLTEIQAQKLLGREGREKGSRKVQVNGKLVEVPNKNAVTALSPQERAYAAESAALSYFVGGYKNGGQVQPSRLPKRHLAELQRKSGKIAPSEGILIDANGKVAHQAIGYGEDHYLPFNLKNLGALKGGSYVRTRESGGLTTEDIYTGLMTGARSMTVVSNSGVFTVDFADDLRGGRRYNDKARQMVDRYGKTLDAVKSNDVSNPNRMLSSRDKARIQVETMEAIEADPILSNFSEAEKNQWVKDAIQRESTKPQLSADKVRDIENKVRDLADDPREQKIAYRELYDQAMDEMSTRNYQLDGEGYSVALDALQEQFPYYIQDVRYQTKSGARGNDRSDFGRIFKPGNDEGYVKPNYNRPQGVSEGYYDKTITGQGKQSADQTGYQNWSVRGAGSRRVTPESGGEVADTNAPAQAAAPKPGSVEEVKQRFADSEKAAKEQARLDDAIKSDLDEWTNIHAESRKAQQRGISGEYETFHEYMAADPEDRVAMLADTTRRAKLMRDLDAIDGKYGKDLGGDVPRERKLAAKKTTRTQMSPEALQADQAPKTPLAIEDAAAFAAASDASISTLLGRTEPELLELSQTLRDKRKQYRDPKVNNVADAEKLDPMIRSVEYARAVIDRQGTAANEAAAPITPEKFQQALSGKLNELPKVKAAPSGDSGTRLDRSVKRLESMLNDPDNPYEKPQFDQDVRDIILDSDMSDAAKQGLYRQLTGNILR